MSYVTAYNECDDSVDPHYSRTCDDVAEKGRIRRGAWIHKSVVAAILAAPTVLSTWETPVADGKVILLPELSGTFDGGTPKFGPGFGDQKEKLLGSDFKANLKDPVYADNFHHYASLAGKTSWHLAYCSESKIHITGVPVTISSKNPITENLDDDVIWETECSWFQFFTPAPHDLPDGLFTN